MVVTASFCASMVRCFHRSRRILFFLILAPLIVGAGDCLAETALRGSIQNYLAKQQKKYGNSLKIGVAVADAETGQLVFTNRGGQLMTPASVVKTVTAVAAFKMLGADYRFPTEVFVDKSPQDTGGSGQVGNLYVRGYGDPTLVDQRLWHDVRELKFLGVEQVNNIVLDDTLFIDPEPPSGHKPYQAGLGALSLNHNNYAIHITPTKVGRAPVVTLTPGSNFKLSNTIKTTPGSGNKLILGQSPLSRGYKRSSTQQSPSTLSPLAIPEVKVIAKGKVGINAGPLTYYRSVPDPTAYFGSVMRHFMEKVGIEVRGRILICETPVDAERLHVFESEPLAEIVRDLNHYSNNFIAGQILYALGQDTVGYFRQDIALKRIDSFMSQLGITASEYSLYDGSGLDKRNKMTPEQLVKVLVYGYQDFSMAPDFIASLSRYGSTGTLRKRKLSENKKQGNGAGMIKTIGGEVPRARAVWGKTGTLNLVSTLAGYAKGPDSRTFAYAILVNGNRGKPLGTRIEDDIVGMLIR